MQCATVRGRDRCQARIMARAEIAEIAGRNPRVTSMLTDSVDLSFRLLVLWSFGLLVFWSLSFFD
jgi:hypothetical protein